MRQTTRALAATLAFTTTAAFAQPENTLVISSWVPPTHNINTRMLPGIIEMIEEATDGRVTEEIRMGLAPPPAQMELVLDGAVDIGDVFHGYQPGRYVGYKLVELPGLDVTDEAASVAYWNLFENHLAAQTDGNSLRIASEADREMFAPIVAEVTQSVVAEISESGIDAAAALASFRAELGVE